MDVYMYMAQMLGAPREMLGAQWQMEVNTWSSMENACLGSTAQAPIPGLHSPNPGLDSPSLTPHSSCSPYPNTTTMIIKID